MEISLNSMIPDISSVFFIRIMHAYSVWRRTWKIGNRYRRLEYIYIHTYIHTYIYIYIYPIYRFLVYTHTHTYFFYLNIYCVIYCAARRCDDMLRHGVMDNRCQQSCDSAIALFEAPLRAIRDNSLLVLERYRDSVFRLRDLPPITTMLRSSTSRERAGE